MTAAGLCPELSKEAAGLDAAGSVAKTISRTSELEEVRNSLGDGHRTREPETYGPVPERGLFEFACIHCNRRCCWAIHRTPGVHHCYLLDPRGSPGSYVFNHVAPLQAQRAQKGLIKEYSLHYVEIHNIVQAIFLS